jgi:aspartate racemase
MRRIGILGGASAESTVDYYRYVTREYTRRFGDYGYPEIVVFSVTFQRFVEWMESGDWRSLADAIAEGLRVLGDAGAEIAVLASNTFHRVYDEVAASASMPLISILDVVSDRLKALGCRRPALLGTRMTMAGSFYADRLSKDGIETSVPSAAEREAIHRVIFEELGRGIVSPTSKTALLGIARRLVDDGADAVILGCTELPLLVEEDDLSVPILDTTRLHANAAFEAAIG